MAKALQLPIIDLASPDRISTANSIRQEIPEVFPSWRPTIESYYERVLTAGKKLISLIALALNLDEDFFEKVGAFNPPMPFLRELGLSDEEIFGASAHSDYGMITLLATDGVGGLQACLVDINCDLQLDKSKQPLVWEDVDHINGALIVNIGDMTERWTNCLFRADCVVECLESCCSELTPPRELRLIGHDVMQISTSPQWRLPGREVQAYIWFIGLSLKASCLEKAEYLVLLLCT
ncbi:hypothetical protein TEA_027632 [Camellia sinensis var. sinensis]|uniref:Isopenicillin N synthase-like Fe(2+) 2OG dioxygenase domain-containing protein n=1 Tax=Camellia sinensis var. sinensis TaxID=542762 RepID=A0A4S4DLX2_CAMSN|nr:hypothetical protein TEA_027632 [Camellia sinensis var. sinensis]